jgi:hypothetical protein
MNIMMALQNSVCEHLNDIQTASSPVQGLIQPETINKVGGCRY